jgi:hypothetical protein
VRTLVPLPLAPPPYRAEAIHSWLTRVASPYSMNSRQLLRALRVKPFDCPAWLYQSAPLESALDSQSRSHLARLARCDPSRLRRIESKSASWALVNDTWAVFCPRCILNDFYRGVVPYERTLWRLAIRTVCPTHRCCLRIAKALPTTAERCQWLIETPTDLEIAVIEELISFERMVATARPGSPVEFGDCDVVLDGDAFVSIFRDLTTYCVEAWDTKNYRRICLAERQVGRLPGGATRLFQRERRHPQQHLGLGKHHELIHVADPAVRRMAIWLVLQVIAYPAPPARLNAMRLGKSPHADFLGPWDHQGFGWLAERAQSWPSHYLARCWGQFLPSSLINEGTVSSIKV